MANTQLKITVDCSECMESLKINRQTAKVVAKRPSNGVRGAKHIPAHTVETYLIDDDGDLLTWECPLCEYADSFDLNN